MVVHMKSLLERKRLWHGLQRPRLDALRWIGATEDNPNLLALSLRSTFVHFLPGRCRVRVGMSSAAWPVCRSLHGLPIKPRNDASGIEGGLSVTRAAAVQHVGAPTLADEPAKCYKGG